jgi:glycosyltransferase involved in cell wall biosynthesis
VKIVYIVTRADAVGGASIHVRDLARAMLDRGHAAIVAVGGVGPVTEQLAAAGVPFRSVESLRRSIHPVRDVRALAELTSLLRELGPDLVSTHTAKAGWIGRAACARLGLPAIYTPHGLAVGDRISAAAGAVFTLAERVAARWTRAILCVSNYERKLALARRIAPAEKIQVVHNGVRDIHHGLRAEPDREPVRICSVARLEAPKDPATLLKALGRLRSTPWELDVVGDGPLESSLRRQAQALGIAARVHFLGYREDPSRTLAGAQLFALSTRSEAFPRSLLEAMRAGLPSVASDVGGVAEAVAHGATGLLVPPGDAGALAAAIGELAADPARRARMGAAARAVYDSTYRLERMVGKTTAIYATVLDRAGTFREHGRSCDPA